MSRLIYVHEMDEYVGPFLNRRDAEIFLALMETCGESLEGVEIVEIDGEVKSVPNAVSADERKQLLGNVRRTPQDRSR